MAKPAATNKDYDQLAEIDDDQEKDELRRPLLRQPRKRYRVVCHLNAGHVALQTILWMTLSCCTLGFVLPFFVYFFYKTILNTIEIVEA